MSLPTFDLLPQDVIVSCCEYLSIDELSRLQVCNKALKKLCALPQLWSQIVLTEPFVCEQSVTQTTAKAGESLKSVHLFSKSYDSTPVILQNDITHLMRNSLKQATSQGYSGSSLVPLTQLQPVPLLVSLQLDGCHQLSDIILWSVLSQVGNSLIQLSLKGAKLLSTQSAVAITQFCPHIEWLSLSGCCKISDQELVTLSQLQLQYLDLSECHKITDNGLEVLATQLARSLHALLLRCFQVTDQGLFHIANHCEKLIAISIHGCFMITDIGLSAFANRPNYHSPIKSLDIRNCPQVTNSAVRLVMKRFGDYLKLLLLAGCSKLSDELFVTISKLCPNLEFIDLSGCFQCTDVSIHVILKSCTNLLSLNANSCGRISAGMLKALTKTNNVCKLSFCSSTQKVWDDTMHDICFREVITR